MLVLHDLLTDTELGLDVIGTDFAAEREIRWAHVSELEDPTPWLLGGEFLLTTGINIPSKPAACAEYCLRLANAGVVALGLSFGEGLPHRTLPATLTAAAEAAQLTLIQVPEQTLLQSIVRTVSDRLHEQHSSPLRDALDRARKLNEAAAGPNGVTGVLSRLADSSNFRAVVYDERLRVLAATDDGAPSLFVELRESLNERLSSGMRWSMATEDGQHSMVALPLGTEGRLRGILVLGKPSQMDVHDRMIIGMVVSLLGVLLELRHAASSQQRLRRSRAMDAVLDPATPQPQLAADLTGAGIKASRYAVLIVDKPAHRESLPTIAAILSERTGDLLIRDTGAQGVLVLCDPHSSEEIAAAVKTARAGRAGLSDVVGLAGLHSAVRQARFALSAALAHATDFVSFPEIGSYQTLLSMGSASDRRAYANSVLGPVDDCDPDGKQGLIATLGAYVACAGRIEATAERIGVHRHTVRARMARIGEVTNRDLENGPDLFELWLALELRGLGENDEAREGTRHRRAAENSGPHRRSAARR